jgi:hypothetical protein
VKRIHGTEVDGRPSVQQWLSSNRYPHQTVSGEDAEAITETVLSNFAAFLMQIDEKLNRILDTLGADQPDPDAVEVSETMNISGSGASLLLKQPLDVGQLLEISLKIPYFPLGLFKTKGKVVRVLPRRYNNEDLFEVGIQFLNLSDEQREKIVAYTFQQQRKRLRGNKSDR